MWRPGYKSLVEEANVAALNDNPFTEKVRKTSSD